MEEGFRSVSNFGSTHSLSFKIIKMHQNYSHKCLYFSENINIHITLNIIYMQILRYLVFSIRFLVNKKLFLKIIQNYIFFLCTQKLRFKNV